MTYFKNSDGRIISSSDPRVVAASGVNEEAIAQAGLSEEKDIQQLLGDNNETEDSV
jgi:hypothetical protein